jgi:hypothetical protein
MKEQRKCLFCGNSDLTKEHVFPKWVFTIVRKPFEPFKESALPLDVLNESVAGRLPRFNEDFSDGRRVSRDNFKLRLLCRTCNNGWMSDAEALAKRLIGDLLLSQSAQRKFTLQESYDLAHWALLKALVLAKACQGKIQFLDRIYYDVQKGRIPTGVYVEMAVLSSIEIDWSIFPIMTWKAIEEPKEVVAQIAAQSLVCAFQIGCLAFRVSVVPPHPTIRRQRVGYQTEILHPFGSIVSFKECTVPDSSSRIDLVSFCSALGLLDFENSSRFLKDV